MCFHYCPRLCLLAHTHPWLIHIKVNVCLSFIMRRMSFEDFVTNFQEIQLCHLQIDAMVEELRDNQVKEICSSARMHTGLLTLVT